MIGEERRGIRVGGGGGRSLGMIRRNLANSSPASFVLLSGRIRFSRAEGSLNAYCTNNRLWPVCARACLARGDAAAVQRGRSKS